MILDSHCHAWEVWPYESKVPDPSSRSIADQLIFEMDLNEVDRALVVCANIDRNPANNQYVYDELRRFPNRLIQIADVDCLWSATYHTPGADKRLEQSVLDFNLKGFTHYVSADDDGSWFFSTEGKKFFAVAARLNQLVSIALPSTLVKKFMLVAQAYPGTPFLLHHLGVGPVPGEDAKKLEEIKRQLEIVKDAASVPNIHVKFSGFHHLALNRWDYPFNDLRFIAQGLYSAYGPDRLHWGSDFPVVAQYITYRQSIEVFRSHCSFIPENDMKLIMGDSLCKIIDKCGVS